MADEPISRHRTAIHRADLSRPIRLALSDIIINGDSRLLDYGCGHGDDVDRLRALATGTFQKYYDRRGLNHWIDEALGEHSVAAEPGLC